MLKLNLTDLPTIQSTYCVNQFKPFQRSAAKVPVAMKMLQPVSPGPGASETQILQYQVCSQHDPHLSNCRQRLTIVSSQHTAIMGYYYKKNMVGSCMNLLCHDPFDDLVHGPCCNLLVEPGEYL